MDVRDFLQRPLVDDLIRASGGVVWRMGLSRRVDIEDLSSADVVMQALFVEGVQANPSAGILIGKSRLTPTEHSIGICSRFLGGVVDRVFSVSIEGIPLYVGLVRQPSPAQSLYTIPFALYVYSDSLDLIPLWAPSTAPAATKSLVGVFTFQLWSTLPRVYGLRQLASSLLLRIQNASMWQVPVKLPETTSLPKPNLWFQTAQHDFGFQGVKFSGELEPESASFNMRVRCWKNPNSRTGNYTEFYRTVNGAETATVEQSGLLLSSRATPLSSRVFSARLNLANCMDVAIWAADSKGWSDQVFVSMGSFSSSARASTGDPIASWEGGVSDAPNFVAGIGELLLPSSVLVTGSRAESVELNWKLSSGPQNIASFRFLQFFVRASSASSFALSLVYQNGNVTTASFSVPEGGCWIAGTANLLDIGGDLASISSIAFVMNSIPNGQQVSFALAGIRLMPTWDQSVPMISGMCSSARSVTFLYTSSSQLTAGQWIGIGFGIAIGLALLVFVIGLFVIRSKKISKSSSETSLVQITGSDTAAAFHASAVPMQPSEDVGDYL